MEQIVIDGPKALALVREFTEGRDDFIYDSPNGDMCVYEHNSEASCLVGQALAKEGVTAAELRTMDQQEHTIISRVVLPERVTLTNVARNIFYAAQRVQDRMGTWGDARRSAENEARALRVLTD